MRLMRWDEMAVVGRIARAHGLLGQVLVNLETDFPEERFRPGSELFIARAGRRSADSARGRHLHGSRSGLEADCDRSARRADRRERAASLRRDPGDMVTFDIVTIFPAMIEQPLAAGIVGRAIERGTLDVKV